MKELIVAREKEKAVLEQLLNDNTAQMLAVYGRRRTGKTGQSFFPVHDGAAAPLPYMGGERLRTI